MSAPSAGTLLEGAPVGGMAQPTAPTDAVGHTLTPAMSESAHASVNPRTGEIDDPWLPLLAKMGTVRTRKL
jgi:hypothetical protein